MLRRDKWSEYQKQQHHKWILKRKRVISKLNIGTKKEPWEIGIDHSWDRWRESKYIFRKSTA